MKQLGSQGRATYDRLFPERQIILRCNGSVRGVVVSPRRQVYATLWACAAAIWCVYASASVLGQDLYRDGAIAALARDRAKYSRWLNEARAQADAARQLVEERTRRIDEFTRQLENRHQILRWLLEYSRGVSQIPQSPRPERDESVSLALAHTRGPAVEPTFVAFAPEQVAWPGSAVMRAAGNDHDARSAASADAAAQPSSIEFVAYLRDPVLAERVSEVAQRVAAARAAAAQ